MREEQFTERNLHRRQDDLSCGQYDLSCGRDDLSPEEVRLCQKLSYFVAFILVKLSSWNF
jgi:hypothetical protein